jgi:DNA-binding XRE family transcriptional regulator
VSRQTTSSIESEQYCPSTVPAMRLADALAAPFAELFWLEGAPVDRLLRDEREASADRSADRLAYVVLSFGLLAMVAYRSFVEGVSSWGLLALVLLGGVVGTAFRLWKGVLSRQAVLVLALTTLMALVVGAAVVLGSRPLARNTIRWSKHP